MDVGCLRSVLGSREVDRGDRQVLAVDEAFAKPP